MIFDYGLKVAPVMNRESAGLPRDPRHQKAVFSASIVKTWVDHVGPKNERDTLKDSRNRDILCKISQYRGKKRGQSLIQQKQDERGLTRNVIGQTNQSPKENPL